MTTTNPLLPPHVDAQESTAPSSDTQGRPLLPPARDSLSLAALELRNAEDLANAALEVCALLVVDTARNPPSAQDSTPRERRRHARRRALELLEMLPLLAFNIRECDRRIRAAQLAVTR